jgi:hypothetical protein
MKKRRMRVKLIAISKAVAIIRKMSDNFGTGVKKEKDKATDDGILRGSWASAKSQEADEIRWFIEVKCGYRERRPNMSEETGSDIGAGEE